MTAAAATTEDAILADKLRALGYLQWLEKHCGYSNVRPLPGERWAALEQFLYSHAIIVGQIGDRVGYSDRWCYRDRATALAALDAWDGRPGSEPDGWHRQPGTGRRRPNGDAAREYIEP